jgi:DNA repair exonuclease SbcCD ATPase subunit
VITEEERQQRLRDINEVLRTLQKKQALLDDLAENPDTSHDRADVRQRIAELRAERAALQEPGALDVWGRINAMWKIVNDLHLDMRERWRREEREREARQRQIDIWLGGVTTWLAVLTLAVWWLASQVWRITELWR